MHDLGMHPNLIAGLFTLAITLLNFHIWWRDSSREAAEKAKLEPVKLIDQNTTIDPTRGDRGPIIARWQRFNDGRYRFERWEPFVNDLGRPDIRMVQWYENPGENNGK